LNYIFITRIELETDGSGSRRRSRLEIIYTVLKLLSISGPFRKTRIMQYANLNTRKFKDYVDDMLVKKGFIDIKNEGGLYEITQRGRQLLQVLEMLSELSVIRLGDSKDLRTSGKERNSASLGEKELLEVLKKIGYRDVSLVPSQRGSLISRVKMSCSNGNVMYLYFIKGGLSSLDRLELMSLIREIKGLVVFLDESPRPMEGDIKRYRADDLEAIILPISKDYDQDKVINLIKKALEELKCSAN
jgi:predicted transcriptional regulator